MTRGRPSRASGEEEPREAGASPPPGAGGGPPAEPPVLPDRAAEDRAEAWGDRTDEEDDERYLRERPPHW